MSKLILLFCVLFLLITPAQSKELAIFDDFTINVGLMTHCAIKEETEEEHLDAMLCLGYIAGVSIMLQLRQKDSPVFCLPDDHDYGHSISDYLAYIEKHPEDLHKESPVGIQGALIEAHPCDQGDK